MVFLIWAGGGRLFSPGGGGGLWHNNHPTLTPLSKRGLRRFTKTSTFQLKFFDLTKLPLPTSNNEGLTTPTF